MNKVELVPVSLDPIYAKKWNERSKDFHHLYKDGKKISNTLYRIGGFGTKINEPYFILLKHVEAYYDDEIDTTEDGKRHLESQSCILDQNGAEKVNFRSHDMPYLQGGVIYALQGDYYNIETGFSYCKSISSSILHSENYIFIEDKYNKDKEKRGVIQITKKDGSYKLIQ